MIAVVPEKRSDSRSSFRDLIQYLIRKENFKLFNPTEEKISLEPFVRNTNIIEYEHNCLSLSTIINEMDSVSYENPKVVDPVYHLIVSWDKKDNPTREQIFDCAKYALESIGFTNNQYLIVIHRDKEHVHAHVAANRINMETHKAVDLWDDYKRLDYSMRELENKHNFCSTIGYYCTIDNKIEKVDKKVHTLSSNFKLSKMNYYSTEQSFSDFFKKNIKKTLMKKIETCSDWQDIHSFLNSIDVSIIERGRGLVFKDNNSDIFLKASSIDPNLSKLKLEQKFGQFHAAEKIVDPLPSLAVVNQIEYKQLSRNANERAKKRIERLQARESLKNQYRHYSSTYINKKLDKQYVKERFRSINETKKAKRFFIRNNVIGVVQRKALYSLLAFESLKAKEVLKKELRAENKALRNNNKKMTYREWVYFQANKEGNIAAKSQVRSWEYSQKRDLKKKNINRMS